MLHNIEAEGMYCIFEADSDGSHRLCFFGFDGHNNTRVLVAGRLRHADVSGVAFYRGLRGILQVNGKDAQEDVPVSAGDLVSVRFVKWEAEKIDYDGRGIGP
jgi:hypothetical protein